MIIPKGELVSNIGCYGKLLEGPNSVKKMCKAVKEKIGLWGSMKMGVVDEAVSKEGVLYRVIVTDERDFVLDVKHKNGLHFQHSLTFNDTKTSCVESPRGRITSAITPSGIPDGIRTNFFEVEGLTPRFISSEGPLGHPSQKSKRRFGGALSMLTPEESNFIRDYVLLRNDDRAGVEKIFHKFEKHW